MSETFYVFLAMCCLLVALLSPLLAWFFSGWFWRDQLKQRIARVLISYSQSTVISSFKSYHNRQLVRGNKGAFESFVKQTIDNKLASLLVSVKELADTVILFVSVKILEIRDGHQRNQVKGA